MKTYYVLDLDRTLFDTVKATELMRGVIALYDTTLAASLEQRFEEYESQGESFSMRDFIVEHIGEERMQSIEGHYHEAASHQDLLLPKAKELIAFIRSKNDAAMGILTYGSLLGQKMKIEAAVGLENIPYLITSETYKGALIASWRQDDGRYLIPQELGGQLVQRVILVDDKPFSFKGLPIDCLGYFVKSVYDAGIEKLPVYVRHVETLGQVVSAEIDNT